MLKGHPVVLKPVVHSPSITFVSLCFLCLLNFVCCSDEDKGKSIPAFQIGESINFGDAIFDFEIDRTGNQLYVSMAYQNVVRRYDLATRELKEEIMVGPSPRGINLSQDKSTLYVALQGSGEVGILDLDTKQVTTVDVKNALNSSMVSDVIEGAPGRVFVTCSNDGSVPTYLAVIKTDENNDVERFIGDPMLFALPVLCADYGKFIYLSKGFQLYKLDPYGNYAGDGPSPVYEFPSILNLPRRTLLLNASGAQLYTEFEGMNTDPLSVNFQPLGGDLAPLALSSDGTVVYLYDHKHRLIRFYNTTTQEQIDSTPFFTYSALEMNMLVTPDDSTLLILRPFSNMAAMIPIE